MRPEETIRLAEIGEAVENAFKKLNAVMHPIGYDDDYVFKNVDELLRWKRSINND